MEGSAAMSKENRTEVLQEELVQLGLHAEMATWSDPELLVRVYETEAGKFEEKPVPFELNGDTHAAEEKRKVSYLLNVAADLLRENIKGAKAMEDTMKALDENDKLITSMEQSLKEQERLMKEGFTAVKCILKDNTAKLKQQMPLALSAFEAHLKLEDLGID